jgi:DnaK suppressor protein
MATLDRLSPQVIQELQLVLEHERTRLTRQVQMLAEAERVLSESQAEEGADHGQSPDAASQLVEAETVLSLGQADLMRLREVESALRRIAEDRYGMCERCGEPIVQARLYALPATRYCRDCASSIVSRSGQLERRMVVKS